MYSYVTCMYLDVIRMYSCVLVCYSYVLVCYSCNDLRTNPRGAPDNNFAFLNQFLGPNSVICLRPVRQEVNQSFKTPFDDNGKVCFVPCKGFSLCAYSSNCIYIFFNSLRKNCSLCQFFHHFHLWSTCKIINPLAARILTGLLSSKTNCNCSLHGFDYCV